MSDDNPSPLPVSPPQHLNSDGAHGVPTRPGQPADNCSASEANRGRKWPMIPDDVILLFCSVALVLAFVPLFEPRPSESPPVGTVRPATPLKPLAMRAPANPNVTPAVPLGSGTPNDLPHIEFVETNTKPPDDSLPIPPLFASGTGAGSTPYWIDSKDDLFVLTESGAIRGPRIEQVIRNTEKTAIVDPQGVFAEVIDDRCLVLVELRNATSAGGKNGFYASAHTRHDAQGDWHALPGVTQFPKEVNAIEVYASFHRLATRLRERSAQ